MKIIIYILSITLLFLVNNVLLSEYCPQLPISRFCDDYCCGSSTSVHGRYCCISCFASINYHPDCYSFNYNWIVLIIIGIFLFISGVVTLILICCGCLCSSMTGITRRSGRVIRPPQNNVIVTTNAGTYPNYTQQQNNPPGNNYPQQQYNAPTYNTYQNQQPPYNPGYIPDQTPNKY